jgi:hypothetical protein
LRTGGGFVKASNFLASVAAVAMAATPIAAQAGTRAGEAQVSLTVLSAQAPVGAFAQEAERDQSILLILLLALGAVGAAALALGGATENDSSRGTGG